jgi:hypothetical protein
MYACLSDMWIAGTSWGVRRVCKEGVCAQPRTAIRQRLRASIRRPQTLSPSPSSLSLFSAEAKSSRVRLHRRIAPWPLLHVYHVRSSCRSHAYLLYTGVIFGSRQLLLYSRPMLWPIPAIIPSRSRGLGASKDTEVGAHSKTCCWRLNRVNEPWSRLCLLLTACRGGKKKRRAHGRRAAPRCSLPHGETPPLAFAPSGRS